MSAAVDAELEPDDDCIYRFLSWWFAACNHGVIELGWTDERTGDLKLFRRFELDDTAAATRFAAETNARPGANLYFRPATVKADTQYTRDDDVVQIPGCWGDCDTEESVARVLAVNGGIAPSGQIITGRIPALRSQFVYKFSNAPLLDATHSRELNRQVQTLAGGDPMVVNPSTLLRLPGSIAWPWKPGRQAELTEWITPDGGGHTVTPDLLRLKLPAAPVETTSAKPNGATTTDDLLNPIQALIDRAKAGPLWHIPVLQLVAKLMARGTPTAAILAMADHITWPKYTVAQTRDALVKMIDGARRKGFDGGEDDAGADDTADMAEVDVADVMDIKPTPSTTFPLLTTADLDAMPDPEWLIEDWLVANTLCVVYGKWASYKSFLALHAALCLATGTPFFGQPVHQCDTLYIAGEGAGGLKLRVAAWKQHHSIIEPINGFRVVPLAVNLMDKAEAERLILTVAEAEKAGGFNPRVVIVDTLHRAMPGADENAAKDIGVAIANGNLIQRRLDGATLIPVHHSGKDPERGMRGSTGLPGAADTSIRVTRDDGRATVLLEKQKDAPDGLELNLQASVIALPSPAGILKPRTSLVLVPGQSLSGKPQAPRPKGETGIGYDTLANVIVTEGSQLPGTAGFPSTPTQGATVLAWRREFYRRLGDKTTEAKRQAYSRMVKSLRDANLIAMLDDWVWLTKPHPEV